MKKNWIVLLVALLLAIGLVFLGCPGEGPNTGDPDDPKKPDDPVLNDFVLVANNGVLNKESTTIVLVTFETSVPSGVLTIADFTVSNDTGEVENVTLVGAAGPNRQLRLGNVIKQGNIKVKIDKEGFTEEEKTVFVFKKLGFVEDDTVTIGEVVRLGGTPTLPDDTLITFARNDGDPIAILPPRTYDKISNNTLPLLEHVIAQFDPPLDLRTEAGVREFRSLELTWDGFGTTWEFETPSGGGNYTGTVWDLHKVMFQIDFTTSADLRVRFSTYESETNTTTGEKVPAKIENIASGAGNTAWGAGHQIKEITLRVVNMQFRSPSNNAWMSMTPGTLDSETGVYVGARNPDFVDMWVSGLTIDTTPAPLPLILYTTAGGWNEIIINPKWGHGDDIDTDISDGIPPIPSLDQRQNGFRWDPIDITTTGTGPYSRIVFVHSPSLGWYGYGSKSLNAAGDLIKQQQFGGATGGQVPLESAGYSPRGFNFEKFVGFFFQGNHTTATNITITEIRIE